MRVSDLVIVLVDMLSRHGDQQVSLLINDEDGETLETVGCLHIEWNSCTRTIRICEERE